MDENDNKSSKRSTGLIIGGIAIIAVLILVGLFLPPISLGQRLGLGSSETAGASTEEATGQDLGSESGAESAADMAVADGVALSLSEGNATIAIVPQSEFLAEHPDAMAPDQVAFVSDVFTIAQESGAAVGQVALPIPAGAGNYDTLDLYGWDGDAWVFFPSQIDANSAQIVSMESPLPQAMAMAQVSAPESASAGAEVVSGDSLPAPVLALLSEVSVGDLFLNSDGTVSGEVVPLPESNFDQWLRTTNVGPVTDQAALVSLLNDGAAQENLINTLGCRC